MDTRTSNFSINTDHPAHLWIGHKDMIGRTVQSFFQSYFCKKNGCTQCADCTAIEKMQFHALTFIRPEKSYTLDDLQAISSTIAFQLQPDTCHWFVLEQADFLTPQCANSLLKSIEEPPPGYRFLLLAHRLDDILPTIRSRCITRVLDRTTPAQHHPIYDFFTSLGFADPAAFAKVVDDSKINERETLQLLDEIFGFWLKAYKTVTQENQRQKKEHALQAIKTIKKAFKQLPMPGSSKLFWRSLFMEFKA